MMPQSRSFPLPSIQRLPVYLRFLKEQRERGETVVSCTRIAEEFGQLSVQVRKDLSITGIIGRPKVGYRIEELIEAIEEFLGWNSKIFACLVGAGSLGNAILGYEGFVEHGLNISCAFDVDPQIIGTTMRGRPVYNVEDISRICAENTFELGILTVPASAAQRVANALLDGGVHAFWNYTPARLELPTGVVCEDVKLSASFAILSSRLKNGPFVTEQE